MQEEINLTEIVLLLKKHFLKFIVATIIGAILFLGWMVLFVNPTYQSQTQILVNQRSNAQQTIQINEIQSNIQLINTYRDIIIGDQLLSQVSQQLEGAYSVTELKGAVSVMQAANSQVFSVRVVMDDAAEAQQVLLEITEQFKETLKEIYGQEITSIYVLQPATYNPSPVSPSKRKYLLLGALLGLALSGLYVLAIEVLDNTVKEESFLQELGLTALGDVNRIPVKDIKEASYTKKKWKMG